MSTTESEFIALGDGTKDVLWLGSVLSQLGTHEKITAVVRGDNQGALAVTEGEAGKSRVRHVDVKYLFVEQEIEAGRIK
jgi:hypothetical protein